MITLTGMLDLNKEQAPAVTLRTGDTMRQTELTVDNAVDLSECTAELYMVKPDRTFVIAACIITEDNSIIVSWPEQAAAVKGMGEYCIRITSVDPAYIYSARGQVWIDDHVITEDMIESVAEVNGNVFPDDFALRSEVPTIENVIAAMIKDEEIAENSTWSSDKINGIINQITEVIDRINDYSTTERLVGHWIDDSYIYEKVLINTENWAFTANTWSKSEFDWGDIGLLIDIHIVIAYEGAYSTHYLQGALVDGKIAGNMYRAMIAPVGSYIIIRYTKSTP